MLSSGTAYAQTASQITPETYAPRPQSTVRGSVSIPQAAGLSTPAGAESLKIRLANVQVRGGFGNLDAQTADVLRPLKDREISVAELFEAARQIQGIYAQAGYVLARVTVPEQDLRPNGTAHFVIINGFIERIDVDALHPNVRFRVQSVLQSLVGQRDIPLKKIERALLLASDTPGLQLRSAISAGSQPEGSVLTLDGLYQPITGQVSFDSSLSRNLGFGSWGAGLQANSVLGLGETVYVMLNGDPERRYLERYARNRAVAVGVILPLGNNGLSFNLETAFTRATPDHAALALGTTSNFKRYSARLRYAFMRTRNLSINGEASFDIQEESQSVISPLALPLFEDRLRVVRLKTDATWFNAWGGVFTGSIKGSFGIDGLGARSAADATALRPLSRQGADAEFQRVEIEMSYSQSLAKHLAVSVAGRAQTSFNNALLASEQFGLTGSNGLSTFESGSLRGDNGYVLRAELSSPWAQKIHSFGVTFAPYVFGAIGQARLEAPTALEQSLITAASYGLGLRVAAAQAASFRSANVTLEWGRAHRSDIKRDDDRFSVVTSFQF